MKDPHPAAALLAYYRDSIFILQSAVRDYREGRHAFYRVAALQMRLLLCDTVRRHARREDISLLRRVHPGCRLPAITGDGFPEPSHTLTLDEWIEQPLLGQDGALLSVRQFIRRVCDQDGGAHVDIKPEAGLSAFPQRTELTIRLAEVVLTSLPGAHE